MFRLGLGPLFGPGERARDNAEKTPEGEEGFLIR